VNNNEREKIFQAALDATFPDGANDENYGYAEDLQFIIGNEYHHIRILIFATQKTRTKT
jgi:hypothetical protein